ARVVESDEQGTLRIPRDDVAAWQQATASGDASEGSRIFYHPRGPRCYACHRVDGRGGDVGPDLTGAGTMGRTRLLQSLLQPSAEIAPQYATWALHMNDGRVASGVLVTERGDEQTFADAAGNLFVVQREQVDV